MTESIKKKETDFEAITVFVNRLNKTTKALYKSTLKKYFKTIDQDPEEYIQGNHDYKKDIDNFAISIKDHAPISQKCHVNRIKKFLEYYDIELKKNFWDDINRSIPGKRSISEEAVPEISDLQKILQHTNVRSRAYFLVLASSGIRPYVEGLQIQWRDIDFKTRKLTIRPEVSKTNNRRTTYISEEAKDALLYYKEKYSDYIARSGKRGTKLNGTYEPDDDALIFPFSNYTALEMWNACLKNSGYHQKDKRTGRSVYRLYTLRKFFKTQLSDARIPQPLIEEMLGHDGYLDNVYYKTNKAKEIYDSAMQSVTVFSDYSKIAKQLEPKIQKQDHSISLLAMENQELKKQINEMQTVIKALSSQISNKLDDMVEAKTGAMQHQKELLKDSSEEFGTSGQIC